MLKFIKHGVIFDPSQRSDNPSWMIDFAQAPNAVVLNDRIRIYFCTRGKPDSSNMFVSRLAYVDVSKDNFTQILSVSKEPCLSLGGLGEFDEFGTYPVSVLQHKGMFYACYGGWTRCESVPFNISLGMSESTDGKKFKKFGNGPVLAPYMDEPFVITSPKLRFYNNKFVLSYLAGKKWFLDANNRAEIIYKIRIAFSDDLKNWERLGKNIVTDRLGPDEAQACGDIFYKDNKYHMFFCYREPLDFRNNPKNSYKIGYAFSNNLMDWERDDEMTSSFGLGDNGWDSEMVAYPNVFEVNSKIYMLYGGNGNGKTGFGIAEIKNL